MRAKKRVVGFTGTRKGMTLRQKEELFALLWEQTFCFHHGDCIGSDAEAHRMAKAQGIAVITHPPIDDKARAFVPINPLQGDNIMEPRPYINRNHDIVDVSDILFAAVPGPEALYRRSGTWATVRYARKIGTPVTVILPSGEESKK